ncbi:MAG: IS110 family transposase [Pseudobdellovibrio sp.]
MTKNIIYIGIDVDDNSIHVSAFLTDTGEVVESKTKPHLKGILNKLEQLKTQFYNSTFKLCYEATYIGFTLHRDLMAAGYECYVVAPSSVPRVHGNQIKTDRVDANKLAQFLSAGILTFVSVPDKETEADRDLLRSRQFIQHQLSEVRTHIHSLLRRNGYHYRLESRKFSHWTGPHFSWIEKVLDASPSVRFKNNLRILLQQAKWFEHSIKEYDKAIDELADTDKYKKQVDSLICYKGIKNLFALMMITEIGNIKRFDHPRKLVSWIGLDIREYSSGGKHNRFGITKHGNRYLRTAFVESNQRSYKSTTIGKDLKQRRKGVDPELILIADRFLSRIRKKGSKRYHAGKHGNKIKVASAGSSF